MRHILLATTALVCAKPALADTTISSNTSSNLATATANNAAPDNIIIGSGVTVSPPSGTAITINSNNTANSTGTISFTDINSVRGITATGGLASGITNSGTITLTESYTQTDTNGDGVLDGPFAQGTDRYAVQIGGPGTFTGAVTNSGTITIKGTSSAAIYSSAPISGTVTNTGPISVTGDNSYGLRLGAVGGAVAIGGTTTVTGQNSIGYALTGDVGGSVVVHGSVTTTGYTATTLPTTLTSLTSANLLQGGSALAVSGNVAGGIRVGASLTATTDTTVDTDADGQPDSGQGPGSLITYGAAAALLIGSASTPIAIGPVANGTHGVEIDGAVLGSGVYAGVNATGMQLAGLGGAVTVPGGVDVTGTVRATSNGGTAVGILLGSGATTASLTNSGGISGSSVTTAGGSAQGVLIAAGASLPIITNSGTISATVTTTGGSGTAILDSSGTLASVTNSGTIAAYDQQSTARAIDVSANTTGFMLTQTAGTVTGAIVAGNGGTTINASGGAINGNLALGGGNNAVALSGTAAVTGAISSSAGNDTISLADTSSYSGTLNTGTGADTLTLSGSAVFQGAIANSNANLAVAMNGGTLGFTTTGTTLLRSLSIGGGTISVQINPATGASTQLAVVGATTITGPATLAVTLANIGFQTGSYNVLTSGTLAGSSNLTLTTSTLPYLLTGSLDASDAAGTVAVTIARKTAAQIGLVRSEAQAYDALYTQIGGNAALSSLFLGLTDRDNTLFRLRQMLPDHAGGVFDLTTSLSRLISPGEGAERWANVGRLSLWAQQAYSAVHQDGIDTPGYKGSGWGFSAGGDYGLGLFGRTGLSVGYMFGTLTEGGTDNQVRANIFQIGPYWTARFGGLQLSASGAAGLLAASESRYLTSAASNLTQLYSTNGRWHGLMLSAIGKASYEAHLGPAYLRPSGLLSYYRLRENAYQENDAGSAFDLSVAARTSTETAATGQIALGFQLGKQEQPESVTAKFEVEGGRRAILSSQVGHTTAQFAGGNSFTLDGEDRSSGYVGTVRAIVGNDDIRFVASGTYEKRDGYHDLIGRIGVRGSF